MLTISRETLNEIKAECERALKVIPLRGAEAGGLLFGTVQRRTGECAIIINGSSVFPIEHRFGPAYRLSEADEARFAEAIRSLEGGTLIGAYHSRLGRTGNFVEQGRRIARAFFAGKTSVTLVCFPDPRGSMAATLFIWEKDGQQHQFDFEMRPAPSSAPPPITPTPLNPGRVTQTPAEEAWVEPPRARRAQRETVPDPAPIEDDSEGEAPYPAASPVALPGRRARLQPGNTLMLAGICVAGIMAAAGLLRWGFSGKAAPGSRPAAAPQTVVMDSNGHLDLKVARQGTALQVTWNSSAPESVQAQSGTFTVTDGGINRVMNLTSQDVRTGSLVYLPSSDDLRVELRLEGPSGGYSQSLRVMGSLGAVPPPLFPPALPLPSVPVAPAEQSRAASLVRPGPEVPREKPRLPGPDKQPGSNKQPGQPVNAAPLAAQKAQPARPVSGLQQGSAAESGRGGQVVATMEAAGPASPVAEVSPAPGRATAVGITPGAVAPGGPVPYVAVPAGAARPAAAETSASAPRVDAPAQPAIAAQATSATSPPAPSPAVNAGAAAAAGPPVNATPARPIQKVNPVLPVEFSGRRADPVSEVQIEVLIDPKGKVWSERVLNSSKVFNHALINSAMAAAKKWQFEPARQNGTPVYSQMILKFQFGTARP